MSFHLADGEVSSLAFVDLDNDNFFLDGRTVMLYVGKRIDLICLK